MDAEGISTASKFHESQVCPACQAAVREGEAIHLCSKCGAASHERCWRQSAGCRSYFCRRSARAEERGQPAITITRRDTDNLAPEQLLPASTAYPADRAGRGPRRVSKLAVAALIVAVLSAGLLGCVSLVLAAVALGLIANNSTLRGRWLALTTILLSIALMFGWAWALWMLPWNASRLQHLEFRDSPQALKDVPEPIRGSMRANVVVRTAGRGLVGKLMLGSGVIVSLGPERTLILTNRHVIDPQYQEGRSGPVAPAEIEVFFCSQERAAAAVKWVHPDGADLALLECRPTDVELPAAARLKLPAAAPIGAEVFAVGNPLDLGWTYTKGVISNIRERVINGRTFKVFQTQTPINQGNSGGGLYDAAGCLVGINTWTQDKGLAEGLSFAIAADHAEEVLRPLLAAPGPPEPAKAPVPPGPGPGAGAGGKGPPE